LTTLRIAILGAGRIGQVHARAVGSVRGQTIPDPRKIVMLYEPSEDTLGQSLHIAV